MWNGCFRVRARTTERVSVDREAANSRDRKTAVRNVVPPDCSDAEKAALSAGSSYPLNYPPRNTGEFRRRRRRNRSIDVREIDYSSDDDGSMQMQSVMIYHIIRLYW